MSQSMKWAPAILDYMKILKVGSNISTVILAQISKLEIWANGTVDMGTVDMDTEPSEI